MALLIRCPSKILLRNPRASELLKKPYKQFSKGQQTIKSEILAPQDKKIIRG
jgi:hypothetical protein